MEGSKELYSEVLGVLLALGNKYVKKLPSTMMPYLMRNCNFDTIPIIDKNKRIEEQNISEEARIFLTMLKLTYWCESEDEKNQLTKLLKENERKYQEELAKKYNTDNLFKDKSSNIDKNNINNTIQETTLVKVKKVNIFKRIFDKIKNLFNRK